jgi:hypothetical protein
MITLDGTNGITTPDVDTDGLTVDTNTLFVDAASNNVGIGTSSPVTNLQVFKNSGGLAGVQISNTTHGSTLSDGLFVGVDNSIAYLYNYENIPLLFATNNTERARIDASGSLLVNRTSAGFVGGLAKFGVENTSSSEWAMGINANNNAVVFNHISNSSASVGSISITTTNTAYNTSSDYRLKEDVQPMVGSVDRLMALKPVNFAWKINGERVDGFLAHEAQEVVPEAVTGEKDAVDDEGNPQYQGIDQSKIVPLLVAALQEALTKIEALEARVAALETNA